MIVLITGTTHTGKTALAQRLPVQCEYRVVILRFFA